ncbi:putative N-acetyltransferase YsnE [Bacillus amyloliquefaciens]|nr:putative N-acetyltransferase YsnE [Bacillus amyloliquefaciens]
MSVLWSFFEHFVTIIIPCFPIFDTAFSRNVLQLLPHFWIGTRNRKGQIPCHISGQWNGAGCEPLLWSKKHAQQGWFEVDVRKEDVTAPDVIALLQDHLKSMTMHSPPESIHALNADWLRQPDVTFWSARENGILLGCGALKELNSRHGEIKSMKTSPHHVRKGAANRILRHMLEEAMRRGYQRISLETGSMEAFLPARRLYEKAGFQYCDPFAHYKENPNSLFMTLNIS